MKIDFKKFITSASLANLVLVGEWFNLFSPFTLLEINAHPIINFTSITGVLLAFLYLTVSLYVLFEIRLVIKSPFLRGTLLLFFLVLLLIPLNTFRMYSQISSTFPLFSIKAFVNLLRHPFAWLGLVFVGVGAVVLILRRQEDVWKAFQVMGRVAIPLLVINLALLGNDCYRSLRYGGTVVKARSNDEIDAETLARPRVVWFIFDEFDYNIGFEKRPDWLKVPTWDKLMNESFTSDNAYPPGLNTVTSVPSLLTGVKFFDHAIKLPENILMQTSETSAQVPLSSYDNIFKSSKSKGLKTALFGWALPYCQTFKNQFDRCVISNGGRFDYSHHTMTVFAQVINRTFAPFGHYSVNSAIYDFTIEQSIKVLRKEQFDLVFVHLPFPHAPWEYDAIKEEIVVWHPRPEQGYHENIVLTDKYLGQMLQELKETKRYANATMIFSSDHSWRQVHERDYRVPFIVQMPDRKSVKAHQRIETLQTRQLIGAIQDGRVKTTEDVSAFFSHK